MKNSPFIRTAIATVLAGGILLTGCSAAVESVGTASVTSATSTASTAVLASGTAAAEVLAANEDATTLNADEWSAEPTATITLTGDSASIEGDGVEVDGATVTITAAGTYVLAGEWDGEIVVDAGDDDVVALVLDGVEITSSTSAAIAVLGAEDVAVSLSGRNALTSTGNDDEANAALFSDADLTITGDGSLTVSSSENDGITSQDDLMVLSGEISVDAGDDGLRGKDSLTIEGGTISVNAGGDALKSDNEEDEARGYVSISGGSLDLVAGDEAVHAQTDLVITGGQTTLDAADDGLKAETYLVVAGGTTAVESSYEGVESFYVVLEGGTLDVTATDDGINATSGTSTTTDRGGVDEADDGAMLVISGGENTVDSEGDGLDSNGSILVTGGNTTVFGSSQDSQGALDANGTVLVDGGTILAVGSTGMAVSPDAESGQAWISASLDAPYGADEAVQVLDDGGSAVAEFTSVKSFQSVVLSAAEIVDGAEYTVTVAGQTVATATAGVAAESTMGGGRGGRPDDGGQR